MTSKKILIVGHQETRITENPCLKEHGKQIIKLGSVRLSGIVH